MAHQNVEKPLLFQYQDRVESDRICPLGAPQPQQLSTLATPSPCEAVIRYAETINGLCGHENSGFLSFKAGFMPIQPPLQSMPPGFRKWDTTAAALPRLIKDQGLREALDVMPVLQATAERLPERYLLRASMLLSILAHACVHLERGEGEPAALPPCIQEPWSQVTSRLGRKAAGLSYIDLVVYNWKRVRGTADETLRAEDLHLLVPTVDNTEEHVFYLVQAEILAEATPLLNCVVDAQSAMLARDAARLAMVLGKMTEQLRKIGRRTMMKISASSARRPHLDPVVWTTTVSLLAMPLRPEVPGPGGMASPMFHMMDAFVGRVDYNSTIGEEVLKVRRTYPPNWVAFVEAVGAIPVSDFVQKAGDASLSRSWSELKEAYSGQDGLLGLHRRKVYAFLPIAFETGRSATNAGFKGQAHEEPWVKVNNELEASRRQRPCNGAAHACGINGAAGRGSAENRNFDDGDADTCHRTVEAHHRPSLPLLPVSELAKHCNVTNGFWFAAQGFVYDATPYLRFHPGGAKIIMSRAGRDATADLQAVSHLRLPAIRDKMASYLVGKLQARQFADPLLQQGYDSSVSNVYRAVSLQTIYQNDVSCLGRTLTSAEAHGEPQLTAQKQRIFSETQNRVAAEFIPAMAASLTRVTHAMQGFSRDIAGLEQVAERLRAVVQASDQQHGPPCPSGRALLYYSSVNGTISETVDFLGTIRTGSTGLLELLERLDENDAGAKRACIEDCAEMLALLSKQLVEASARQWTGREG